MDQALLDILYPQINSYIDGIKYALYENDRIASGKTRDSVESVITDYGFQIIADRNIMAIETGRRAGKQPPLENIIKWVEARNLDTNGQSIEAVAFVIARKIGAEGYEGTPNIISGITGDLSRVDRIADLVANYEMLKLSNGIDNVINDTN
jgi:hypothetical protein